MSVQPFVVDLPRVELREPRWPVMVEDGAGISSARVREVLEAWRAFDWDAKQRELNELPHFIAGIDGESLHFIHVRGGGVPLLLLHGWPGSFVEFLRVVPLLAEFDLVIPSLPGYGFSAPPRAPGMSNLAIADRMAKLMSLLGYDRFVAHGGDWGAGIATWLARRFPERVLGIHLNYIPGSYAPFVEGEVTIEEAAFIRDGNAWLERDGAYLLLQKTRPLTAAYALNDSPAGLAAWLVEKFDDWSDPATPVGMDDLLTNLQVYWGTGTIGSSMRLYLEGSKTPHRFARDERLRVPCAVAHFPREEPFPPRSWVERVYDVRRWSELPRGGHFAALEVPELLATDIRAAVRELGA